jgi:hypothetical protein
MESCCWSNYTKHRDAQENLKALDFRPRYDEDEGVRRIRLDPNLSWWQRHQPIVWEILDEPYSSPTAKVNNSTVLHACLSLEDIATVLCRKSEYLLKLLLLYLYLLLLRYSIACETVECVLILF